MENTCLIFYYHKLNRNSFRPLAGAIEIKKSLSKLPIFFPIDEKGLKDDIKKATPVYKKIIIGFSFATAQLPEIKLIIRQIKKQFPKIIAVAGGPHPSGDPKGTLKLGFDIVVVGEGEKALPELVKKIVSGGDWHSRRIIIGKPIDLDRYPPFSIKFNKIGPIEISRGCPWGCKYCQTSYLFGRKTRHRSVFQIAKYAKLSARSGLTDIRFITPNAFGYGVSGNRPNIPILEKLLKSVRFAIGKKGRIFFGTFPSEVRPEFVSKEALGIVKKYCDNNNLIIGAQSGSPKILKEIGRGHSVKDIYNAIKLTKEAGFLPNVDFIFGLPGETRKDQKQTLKVIEDLIQMGAKIHGHYFMPLSGTPFGKDKAVKLDKEIYRILDCLESQGKLYGQWRKQELIAKGL